MDQELVGKGCGAAIVPHPDCAGSALAGQACNAHEVPPVRPGLRRRIGRGWTWSGHSPCGKPAAGARRVGRCGHGGVRAVSGSAVDRAAWTEIRSSAPGPVLMDLRVPARVLDVVVWDSDPTDPAARAADSERVGQHGLEIVKAVVARCADSGTGMAGHHGGPPGLAPLRVPLALVVVVAGLTWFGHGGRLLFAVKTVAFVVISVAVLVLAFASPHATGHAAATTDPGRSGMLAVVLAFPVAMALATGVEAPSTAIAQLGQLDDTDRRRFGRGTLALLVVIVGGLTLALTALAVRQLSRHRPAARSCTAVRTRSASPSAGGVVS